jgi:hypothetical protein
MFNLTNTTIQGENLRTLNGDEREQIQSAIVLPTKPTTKDVTKAAKTAGEIQAQTELLREISKWNLQSQEAALANLEARVKFAESSQVNAQRYQERMSKHSKNVAIHNLRESAQKENLNSYQQYISETTIDL